MQTYIDSSIPHPGAPQGVVVAPANQGVASSQARRVLRNTYALLAMTLVFSTVVAGVSTALKLPAPGLMISLVGTFGLLFAVYKFKDSVGALPAVFALTGFMGYTLGPVLTHTLALPGGGQAITLALGATATTFLGLSAWAISSKRDFSFMGGFLFAGMVIALVAGLAAVWLQMPAFSLMVAALVALLSAGLILFETSRIVHGGETNYVLATVSLYVSIYNLFASLLALFGMGGSDD